MSDSGMIIEAQGVSKSYAMGSVRVNVLKDAGLSVKQGQFVAVIGASGSGKSTLLHLLGGLDRPEKGRVCFRGQDIGRLRSSQLDQYRNRTVGFVFQFYHLLEELNILENVLMPAMAGQGVLKWLACRSGARKRAQDLIDTMGLAHRLKHKPFQLSGGERQRVAIARALMNQPELLLADEPTGNLDSATGNGILEGLERLHQAGQTIVMVTHDSRIAHRASRVITLLDGKIVEGAA
jgi:lipoprotein-releasing system ATP-binding protein